jgi:hypothetical protein
VVTPKKANLRPRRPLLNRGEVYGCWTVMRETSPLYGAKRWMCRASCCGKETAKQHSDILRRVFACIACKGNGKAPRGPGRYPRQESAP